MPEKQDRKDKRKFEADTLEIQISKLVPAAGGKDGESPSSGSSRESGKNSVSGETVRRIIERLKRI